MIRFRDRRLIVHIMLLFSIALFIVIAVSEVRSYILNGLFSQEIQKKNFIFVHSLANKISEEMNALVVSFDNLSFLCKAGMSGAAENIVGYIQEIAKRNSAVELVHMINEKGQIEYSIPPNPDIIGMDVSRQNFYADFSSVDLFMWTNAFLSPFSGRITVSLSHRLEKGIVVCNYNIDHFRDYIRVSPGEKTSVFITDRNGLVIACNDSSGLSVGMNLKNLPSVQKAIADAEGSFSETLNGERGYISVASIDKPAWVIAAFETQRNVSGLVRSGVKITALFMTIFSVLAAFFLFLVLRRFLRPLGLLAAQTKLIAEGKQVALPDSSYREIGELVKNFDTMLRTLSMRENELEKSLREKSVLLKEVHHRVKNNMQVIISLLQLQSKYAESEALKAVVAESVLRIRSMAHVHELFYQQEDFKGIPTDKYVETLLGGIFPAGSPLACAVTLEKDIESLYLDLSCAVPIGLVLNEILTNAFKYAFKGRERGKLRISIHTEDGNRVVLVVQDDGIGLPSDFSIENAKTLGYILIKSLVQQLQGTLNVTSSNGTRIEIRFPLSRL